MSPSLTSLLAHVEREIMALEPVDLPGVIGALERLKAMAQMKAFAKTSEPKGSTEDRLLTVKQAAEMLGMKETYLYGNAKKFPFTVRPTPRRLRFSSKGIQRYIQQRKGIA